MQSYHILVKTVFNHTTTTKQSRNDICMCQNIKLDFPSKKFLFQFSSHCTFLYY